MTPPPGGHVQHDRKGRRQAAVQHRRAQARARVERGRHARRNRRVKVVAVSLVVLLVVGLVAVAVWPEDDSVDVALRGELVSAEGSLLPITASPAAYRVVYRSEGSVGGQTSVFTEELAVRRPFDGHVVVRTGAPPGGAVQYDVTSVLGRSLDGTDPDAPVVDVNGPRLAVGDVRLDGALEDLVADGLFEVRERRRVDGRECQVYRTGAPPQSLSLVAPTDEQYVDVCIDEAGLMLEEVTVVGGAVRQRAVATAVDLAPAFDDTTFVVDGEPRSVADGGASSTPLDAAPAGTWTLATPPAGFTLAGRSTLTRAAETDASATTTTAAGAAPATVESIVEVWVAGPDVIIVEQGPVAAEGGVDVGRGAATTVGALGEATLVADASGNVVRAQPEDGRFVRVTATRPLAELREIAAGVVRA